MIAYRPHNSMSTVTSSINCRDAAIQSITRQCRTQALPFYLRQRSHFHSSFILHENGIQQSHVIPFRKELKEKAKQRRAAKSAINDIKSSDQGTGHWKLTVGIEVHAQLDTDSKLFSSKFIFYQIPQYRRLKLLQELRHPSMIDQIPMSPSLTLLSLGVNR